MRAAAFCACAVLATLGAASASADPFRPSVKDQIQLGKDLKKQVAKEEKVLPATDPRVAEVRELGTLLVSKISEADRKRRPFEYSFEVIDSPELNAFAMPGGPVYIYTGLLDRMETKDEVAGILAHEIIHVQNQHWANAYAQQQKRALGLTVLLGLLGAGQAAYDLAGLADAYFAGLPYSRKHEMEADSIGYDLALRAGFNPKGMVDVFKVLVSESKGKVDERLSTHPDTQRRIKTLEQRLAKDAAKLPAPRPRNPEAARLKSTPKPEKKDDKKKPAA